MLADKFDERHGETGGLAWNLTADQVHDYASRIHNKP
jgi:hypothetical protein